MPFYEYQCKACGQVAEVMQKFSDPPLKKCPSCGRSALTKLMSAPVFRLKGSGWYETDFKTDQDKKRNLAGAEKEEAAAPAKDAPAGKADAKPADKDAAAANDKPAAADKPAAEPAKAVGSPQAASKSASKSPRAAKPAPKRVAKGKARR